MKTSLIQGLSAVGDAGDNDKARAGRRFYANRCPRFVEPVACKSHSLDWDVRAHGACLFVCIEKSGYGLFCVVDASGLVWWWECMQSKLMNAALCERWNFARS